MPFEPLSDAKRWGLLIRDHRQNQLFMTQSDFAARVREFATAAGADVVIDQSTVSRWESGSVPSLRVRPFIAAACGMAPSVLFQRTEVAA